MNVKKKLMIVGSILLGAFLIVNIIWFATVYAQWNEYEENSGVVRDDSGVEVRYYGNADGTYNTSISKPSYLRFSNSGFLCVSFSEPYTVSGYDTGNLVANRDIDITMYFWPDISKEYKCGVMFYDGISGNHYQVYIDKNLDMIDNENIIQDESMEQLKQYMEKYKITVEEMYTFGVNSFGLDSAAHIVE